MNTKFQWMHKKALRSVDNLKLWANNPRLNPDEKHIRLSDFAEDITNEDADKKNFLDLVKSIANHGFIPVDPIVIWKNTKDKKFYVAEGNRRILALKLLRTPNMAPKSIRRTVTSLSEKIDIKTIEKIYVNVAPSFEQAEWYINQRNSTSSLQTPWSRIQQHAWILSLAQKYNFDYNKIEAVTTKKRPELEEIFRINEIKKLATLPAIKSRLTEEEFNSATSYKFPITILERFFGFSEVKQKWGVSFENSELIIESNLESFYNAYTELLKRIINESDEKINTRITKKDLDSILPSLPTVTFENAFPHKPFHVTPSLQQYNKSNKIASEKESNTPTKKNTCLKGDPNRSRLILSIYHLKTDNYRLDGLFKEFKKISLSNYKHTIASGIRVFLDLAILNYIESNQKIESNIRQHFKRTLRDITLKERIQYLKDSQLLSQKVKSILTQLLNSENELSLNNLNGYIHSTDSHFINKEFLNRFWDFIFPLFEYILEVKENNV